MILHTIVNLNKSGLNTPKPLKYRRQNIKEYG